MCYVTIVLSPAIGPSTAACAGPLKVWTHWRSFDITWKTETGSDSNIAFMHALEATTSLSHGVVSYDLPNSPPPNYLPYPLP